VVGRVIDAIVGRLRGPAWLTSGSIAGLPEGVRCRIAGVVEAGEDGLLVAPFTGCACVYYQVWVVDATTPGIKRVVMRERRWNRFVLRDDSGCASIDLHGARLELDRRRTSVDIRPTATAAAAVAARLGATRVPRGFVFHERMIGPGAELVVEGVGVREPDPDARTAAGYRSTPTRLHLAGTGRLPMVVRDAEAGLYLS